MDRERIIVLFFFGLLALISYELYAVIAPVLTPIIWAILLTAVFHVVLTRTRWGLHTVSVGGNQLGAREAGIHVNRIKYGNFMLTGVLG